MELADMPYLVLHSLKAGFHLSLIDNCVEVGGVANMLQHSIINYNAMPLN